MPPLSFLTFTPRLEETRGPAFNADHQTRSPLEAIDLFGSGLTDPPRDSDFAYVHRGPARRPSTPNYHFGPPFAWQYDTFLPPDGRIFQVIRASVAKGIQAPFVDRTNNDIARDQPNSFSRITDRIRGR